jgi:hypothetical protein
MRIDWYTKVVLTLIALALATIALRTTLEPSASYAARAIQYKAFQQRSSSPRSAAEDLETSLNKLGADGWDFAGMSGSFVVMKR